MSREQMKMYVAISKLEQVWVLQSGVKHEFKQQALLTFFWLVLLLVMHWTSKLRYLLIRIRYIYGCC